MNNSYKFSFQYAVYIYIFVCYAYNLYTIVIKSFLLYKNHKESVCVWGGTPSTPLLGQFEPKCLWRNVHGDQPWNAP